MSRRISDCVVLFAIVCLARASAAQPVPSGATNPPAGAWVAPRAADGHADLQGVWENNSATPLERPARFADKPLLTPEELAALERRARERITPDADALFGDAVYLTALGDRTGTESTGNYSQNWLPDRYFERRTSLIVDPADGRLPQPTAQGKETRAAAFRRLMRRPSGPQDLTMTDRCITYGFPDLFAAYMSVYRIIQTKDTVAIQMEKIHDVRVIPLDGRPHLAQSVQQYMGDARGHWEGDSLVVETTNFHPNGNPMGGYLTLSDPKLRLVERFTRTAQDTLEYTFTVDNPTMWTKPWTAVVYWKRAKGEVYEYACHEGNYSLPGILTGAQVAQTAR